jgi:CheY-like chemotaxis protein
VPETTAQTVPPSRLILLGEDDIDDEELLREVFTAADPSYALRFVNNGKKFIASIEEMAAKSEFPCLIVLDYNMPALNGAEILRELKKDKRYDTIPKIIWSTSNSATYRIRCLELGARDYIIKPSSMHELKEVARYMLSFCSVQ